MKKIVIVIEKVENEYNAWVEDKLFFLATVAPTIEEAQKNLIDSIQDYIDHEGATIPKWKGVKASELEYEIKYDIASVFDALPLNATELSIMSGLNPSLVRQYKSGIRKPSREQVDRIQTAIQNFGKKMATLQLV